MRGILHAIFWKFHTAFLRNDRKTADLMLGMLLDEAKRHSIAAEIGPVHFARFELMKHNVEMGHYGRLYGCGFDAPAVLSPPTSRTIEEEAFHKKMLTLPGRQHVYDIIGVKEKASMLHEVDLQEFGRCDFTVREGRTLHCIEVKVGQAKHDLIGQIEKYRIALELEMCHGLHDRVLPHVFAESFSPYVANELSRLSVNMVQHDGKTENFKKLTNY